MTKTVTSQPSEWVDSYGYEYESAKDLLLRNKAKTRRNRTIEGIYSQGYRKEYVQVWVAGFDSPNPEADACTNPDPDAEAYILRRRSAELALATWRDTHSGFEKYDPARLA